MFTFKKILTILTMVGCVVGCEHKRVAIMVAVDDLGHNIATANKYTLVANREDAPERRLWVEKINERLHKSQPQVFGEGGIPFVCNVGAVPRPPEMGSVGWTSIFIPTLVLPVCSTSAVEGRYVVDVLDNPDAHASLRTQIKTSTAFSLLSPAPMLCYLGDPDFEGEISSARRYVHHAMGLMGDGLEYGDKVDDFGSGLGVFGFNGADVYGIAVALKKMEEEGKIDASRCNISDIKARWNGSQMAANVDVIDFHREDSDGYQYEFALRARNVNLSLRESSKVQQELSNMIRNDFAEAHPSANRVVMAVDFTEYVLENGEIKGRAQVLPLVVLGLVYDKATRRGVLRIKVSASRLEVARKYAVRNIEAIVRDKNIALIAGDIPPDANFYSLGEEVKDGVLEVEFRTE